MEKLNSQNVIVMDAGGTNFRVALLHFGGNRKPVIDYLKSMPMPGTSGAIDRDTFYGCLVEALRPVIDKSDRIGFCFSYPTEILPDRDGKLIHFNKEVHISGLEGGKIGEGLLNALKQHGVKGNKRVVLINNTVATLLGGKASVSDRVFEGYIGFILGTGTNTCYEEENRNIRKSAEASRLPGSMIVNIESGGYAGAPRSDFDEAFDGHTEAPGRQLFEKMMSAPTKANCCAPSSERRPRKDSFPVKRPAISKLSQAFLHGRSTCSAFSRMGKIPLRRPPSVGKTKRRSYWLIDAFFSRAAFLAAVNLASILLKTGKGKSPLKPVCVSAEGTTFYKSKLFRPKLDAFVAQELNERLGLYCEFVKSENTTIIGSALAGILE